MKVQVRDETTLVLIAEDVSEHTFLKQFNGSKAETEEVKPFAVNATTLVLKAGTSHG